MKHLIASVLLLCTVLNSGLSNAYDRVTYIHSDGQGSPIAASDDQGNLEWRAEYYPFGAEFRNTEIRRENNTSFSGKPLDEEIGLSYFGARHYDPLIGRFTSIDPVPVDPEDYLTFNRYAYANNNPYKYVDPNGELPFLIPVAIFLGKEIAAELASRATGGATDFLSARRMGTKIFKKGFSLFKKNAEFPHSPEKLYHYTDSKGLEGIKGSNRLNPSIRANNPNDARYGDGQYLSDIAPGTKTCAQLSRCFFGNPFQGKKVENYIEIDVRGLDVRRGRDGVFVVPGGKPLDLTGRIIGSGKN